MVAGYDANTRTRGQNVWAGPSIVYHMSDTVAEFRTEIERRIGAEPGSAPDQSRARRGGPGVGWLAMSLAAALATAVAASGESRRVAGAAVAVDGSTLIVDGHRLRINALYAPALDQPGGASAKAMAALAIEGEYVTCVIVDVDRQGGLAADCEMASDGADLAEVMIRSGRADHCARDGRPDLATIPPNGFAVPDDCR